MSPGLSDVAPVNPLNKFNRISQLNSSLVTGASFGVVVFYLEPNIVSPSVRSKTMVSDEAPPATDYYSMGNSELAIESRLTVDRLEPVRVITVFVLTSLTVLCLSLSLAPKADENIDSHRYCVGRSPRARQVLCRSQTVRILELV